MPRDNETKFKSVVVLIKNSLKFLNDDILRNLNENNLDFIV